MTIATYAGYELVPSHYDELADEDSHERVKSSYRPDDNHVTVIDGITIFRKASATKIYELDIIRFSLVYKVLYVHISSL